MICGRSRPRGSRSPVCLRFDLEDRKRLQSSPVNEGLPSRISNPTETELKKRAIRPKVITNSTGMKLALIPAGEFLMGMPKSRKGDRDNIQHRVRITKPF